MDTLDFHKALKVLKNIKLYAKENILKNAPPLKMLLDKTEIYVIEAMQMSLASNFQLNIYKNCRVMQFFISLYTDHK